MSNFPSIRWIHRQYGDWPSFSPDGKQVVFWLDNALCVINSDGTDLHLLYPQKGVPDISATRPDWSWNADNIAFTYNQTEIWTVHPDGSGATLYCRVPIGWNLYYPSWYRDLEALVAVGYNQANTQAELFKLTPDSAEVLTTSPHPCAGRPSVNPDGTKIAFAGNWGEYKQVQNQIWVVEPPGKPFLLEPGDNLSLIQGRSPNWSPKGDLIVFESTRPFPNPGPSTPLAIWVMNSDGTDPRPLTDRGLFSAYHAEWSRQQTQIVFAAQGMGIGIIDFPCKETG
ncbi:MAG TPA: hypothetical protein VGM86_32330 [Thermoanaerobaculia bacterium]|jgi:Tol biopolymer transport system component